MGDFERYKEHLAPKPFGLVNLGATCYFNAVFQAMMSLTSFTHAAALTDELNYDTATTAATTAATNPELMNSNRTKLIAIFKKTLLLSINNVESIQLTCNKHLLQSAADAWRVIYKTAQERKDNVKLTPGQQCAGEGFHLLLDALGDDFSHLFTHRYQRSIICEKCNEVVSIKREEYCMFEVDPYLQPLPLLNPLATPATPARSIELGKYITNLDGVVSGYKCPKCGDMSDKKRKTIIRMVPEVLVVMSKKYRVDKGRISKISVVTDFPETLTFPGFTRGHDGKKILSQLRFDAVAQIEHSGGPNGGHYWAICKRKGGWYTLNDTRVSPGKFGPTNDTYMVFYHII